MLPFYIINLIKLVTFHAEGINGTISGSPNMLDEVVEIIRTVFDDLEVFRVCYILNLYIGTQYEIHHSLNTPTLMSSRSLDYEFA